MQRFISNYNTGLFVHLSPFPHFVSLNPSKSAKPDLFMKSSPALPMDLPHHHHSTCAPTVEPVRDEPKIPVVDSGSPGAAAFCAAWFQCAYV